MKKIMPDLMGFISIQPEQSDLVVLRGLDDGPTTISLVIYKIRCW